MDNLFYYASNTYNIHNVIFHKISKNTSNTIGYLNNTFPYRKMGKYNFRSNYDAHMTIIWHIFVESSVINHLKSEYAVSISNKSD